MTEETARLCCARVKLQLGLGVGAVHMHGCDAGVDDLAIWRVCTRMWARTLSQLAKVEDDAVLGLSGALTRMMKSFQEVGSERVWRRPFVPDCAQDDSGRRCEQAGLWSREAGDSGCSFLKSAWMAPASMMGSLLGVRRRWHVGVQWVGNGGTIWDGRGLNGC